MAYQRSEYVYPLCSVMMMLVIFGLFTMAEAQTERLEVDVEAVLSERYDDNIDLEEEDFEEDDFITSVTPRLLITYTKPSASLELDYRPGFDFYAENSDENEVRQNGTLTYASNPTPRLEVLIRDTLAFIPGDEVLRDRDFEDRGRRYRSNPSDLQSNDLTGLVRYQVLRTTFLRAFASYRMDNYDKSEFVDSDEYEVGTGVDHELTKFDTLFLTYRYRMFDYSGGSFENQSQNDTDVHSVVVGDNHQFSSSLSLNMFGGVSYIDEDEEDSETEWTGGAMLRKEFRTGSLQLSLERDVSPRSGEGGTTTYDEVDLTGTKEFTRRLNGMFSIYYSTDESVSGEGVDSEETGFIASSTYRFSRRLSATLAGSFVHENSQGEGGGDADSYRAWVYGSYEIGKNWGLFAAYRYYQQNALDQVEEDIENNIVEIGTRVKWF